VPVAGQLFSGFREAHAKLYPCFHASSSNSSCLLALLPPHHIHSCTCDHLIHVQPQNLLVFSLSYHNLSLSYHNLRRGLILTPPQPVAVLSLSFNNGGFPTCFLHGHRYAVAIAHTLDGLYFDGRPRSQVFNWVTASLAIYFADRLWRYYTAHRDIALVSAEVAKDSTMVVLELQRPAGFTFEPGQYASLQIKQFETMYHPFSIGSSPKEPNLRFFIEVCHAVCILRTIRVQPSPVLILLWRRALIAFNRTKPAICITEIQVTI